MRFLKFFPVPKIFENNRKRIGTFQYRKIAEIDIEAVGEMSVSGVEGHGNSHREHALMLYSL